MDSCDLREANGMPDEDCDGTACAFWRVVEQIGGNGDGDGCAIRHYQLLGDDGIARWLLSVKQRLDASTAPATGDAGDGDATE